MVDTTIAARINQLCPFSLKQMDGLEICRFTVQQYNYLFDILRITKMPDELIELVLSFSVFNKSKIGTWGIKLYVNFIELQTKSGRKINKPIKYTQQTFVSGTYDRYDGGYHNGDFYSKDFKEISIKCDTINYNYLMDENKEELNYLEDDTDSETEEESEFELEEDEEVESDFELDEEESEFELEEEEEEDTDSEDGSSNFFLIV